MSTEMAHPIYSRMCNEFSIPHVFKREMRKAAREEPHYRLPYTILVNLGLHPAGRQLLHCVLDSSPTSKQPILTRCAVQYFINVYKIIFLKLSIYPTSIISVKEIVVVHATHWHGWT